MKKQTHFSQSIRSLFMHRLRTFLSALGVLFGVMAVVAMLAIGEGSKREILTQIQQLGTNNIIIRQSELSDEQQQKALQAKSYGLTLQDAKNLQSNLPLIQRYTALKVIKSTVKSSISQISPEVLAVLPSFSLLKGLELSEGRFLCDLDCSQRREVCILGFEISSLLGKRGHVGQNILINNTQFQIVGVLTSKKWIMGKTKSLNSRNLNKSIFIPLGTEKGVTNQNLAGSHSLLNEIILELPKEDPMTGSIEAIKRMMEWQHHGIEDYQIIVPQELLEQAYQTQNIFNLVLGSIAAISMIVGGIGIMNIMLASVSDRTREIGIRRSLGASKYHIAMQFLTETLILSLVGAFLGLIGGVGFAYLIGFFAGWNVVITWWSICISTAMALIVGVSSGLYPSIKAASMDPIAALRHV